MSADLIASVVIAFGLFAFGFAHVCHCYRCKTAELYAANTDLRERLAIVAGQLADERQRHAMRINRAHEGACKAAKTRNAKRIQLPVVAT